MRFILAILNFIKRIFMPTPAQNLQTNSNKVASTTYWPIDQVVFSHTDTFAVNNTVSSVPQTFTINMTGLNGNFGRPIGIFSTDGGTTWNDMGGAPSTSSLANAVQLPAVTVTPQVSSNNTLTYKVYVHATVGGGGTFSLTCSIAVLKVDNAGVMNAVPQITGNTNKTAVASITPSGLPIRYRRIVSAEIIPTTVGTTLHPSPHGLGYVPDAMVWMGSTSSGPDYLAGTEILAGNYQTAPTAGDGNPMVYMDSTNIYYVDNNISNSEYLVRLYKP